MLEISRNAAIAELARRALDRLTLPERVSLLEVVQGESWDDDPEWKNLTPQTRTELSGDGVQIVDPRNTRYDGALLMPLKYGWLGSRNEFLLERLLQAGVDCSKVIGDIEPMFTCPCCGLNTLTEEASYDICKVCWWEDDGLDNSSAHRHSGPNHISLIRGRINVLLSGIFDPGRGDLLSKQESSEKYERGRTFVLGKDGNSMREPSAGWSGSLAEEDE